MNRKLMIVVISLCLLNVVLAKYLEIIISNIKPYELITSDVSLLLQYKDIYLKDTSDFNFDNYFKLYTLVSNGYKYYFDNDYLYLKINSINKTYEFKYTIQEPEIIEKVVYIEKENIGINSSVNSNIYNEIEYSEEENSFCNVNNYVFNFEMDTDINEIRNELASNIDTSYQTYIDYSSLNVSCKGSYFVYYINEFQTIEVIVNII